MKNLSKKIVIALVIAMMMLLTMGITACVGGDYTLYFKVDGEVYDTIKTDGKSSVKVPENPVKEGYTFEGWYWNDRVWTKPFTANSLLEAPISSNMTVYARFLRSGCTVEEEYSYDSLYHWNNCSLGEKHNKREHTLVNGVCSVCRYKENIVDNTTINENWQPAKKNTVFSYEWLVDNNKQLKYDRLTKKQVGYDYYYMYYLGYIDNVVLESENYNSFYLDDKIKGKSTHTTGKVTSNEISQSISSTVSASVTFGFSAEFGKEGLGKISASLETTLGGTESVGNILTTIEKQASEASLESDFDNAPKGYYRLVPCCSIDVFEYAVYNVLSNEFTTYNVAIVDKNVNVMWDYSKDSSRFDDAVVTDTIEFSFDEDYLNSEKERIYSEFYTPVSKVEELFAIRNNPNGNYLLTGDIDLCGIEWTPIETFSGTINGNGHCIYNFSINKTGGVGSAEFAFVKKNDGMITGLTIGKSGVTTYDSKYSVKYNVSYKESGSESSLSVGGFVVDNNGTITNCRLVNAFINVTFADNDNDKHLYLYVGGIATLNNGVISLCTVENSNIDANATCSKNSGDDNKAWLGGICGRNSNTISECVVKSTILDLDVRGDGYKEWYSINSNEAYPWGTLGGIVGEQLQGTVALCTVDGNTLNIYGSSGGHTHPTLYKKDICGLNTKGTVS